MVSAERTTAVSPSLRRYSFWILLLLACAFTFLDYWGYSEMFRADPRSVVLLAHGVGPAPAQYRVGLLYLAKYITQAARGHLGYRHCFAVFDLCFTIATGLLGRGVLMRTRSFLEASPVSQWLRMFVLLGLTAYYFNFSLWYQRPETWASAFFVVASCYVLCAVRSAPAAVAALAGLAVVQGLVRADVAIIFHFALFVYVLFRGARGFLLSRPALLAASFVGGLVSTAILWLLMHKIFPHATYGDTAVVQLLRNLAPAQWVPALLFSTPAIYTLVRGRRDDAAGEGLGHTLLLAAGLYFASWALLGRMEEVRIFAPFAFALAPQTANAVARRAGLA